jgi:hypothetical protein
MLDKFSKTFDKFNRDMSKGASASKAFSSALGGIGVGLSVAGVAAFGMSSVKAYGDALTAQQRLMDAFSKQPQLVGYNVQALMEYNKELSTKIAYDDDEINAAQANLALFKLTGDEIKNITPLVADLARRKGIDLASAATSVGKAMQGQARGLKDLGINFKATGNTAEDYATITALLNKQVGGTAAAFAQGNPLGQLENAKIAFGNMQESVGQALLPAMTALTNVLTPLANTLGKIPQPIMQIGIVIGAAVLGARLLGPAMSGAFAQMRASALAASASVAAAGVSVQGAGLRAAASGVMMRGFAASAAVAGTAARGLMTALGGPIGIAIIGITTAISLFAMSSDDAAESADGWTASLERQNGVLTDNAKLTVAENLAQQGAYDALTKLGISTTEYTAALLEGGDAAAVMRQKLVDLGGEQSQSFFGEKFFPNDTLENAKTALTQFDAIGASLANSATRADQANAAALGLGVATGSVGAAASDAANAIAGYSNALQQARVESGVLSKATNDLLFQFFMPTRNPGESVDSWAARVEEYRRVMTGTLPVVSDYTSGAMGASDATETLSRTQQRALDKANALGEALKSVTAERDSFVAGINDASLSFASIFGFDIKGGVEASQAVTDALQAQAEARAALASIGPADDDARAKAQQDLAAATRDVATAEAASAKAQATGGNVLNSYKGRLAKLQRFSRVMASLAKKGLSALIYQDILGQGIDGGLEMAQAINGDKALIGQLNTTADSIARSTSGMAARAGNYVYGGYVNDAQRRADRGANAATAAGATPDTINVVLKLDSATVYKQLLRLKRERGGQSLGV